MGEPTSTMYEALVGIADDLELLNQDDGLPTAINMEEFYNFFDTYADNKVPGLNYQWNYSTGKVSLSTKRQDHRVYIK